MKKPLFRIVIMLAIMTSSSSLIAAEQGFVVVDFEQFEDTTVCPTYYSDWGAHFSAAILRTGNGDGSVEPSTRDKEQLTSVVAEVTDCEGNPQSDIEVEITVVAVDGSGGHAGPHVLPRPPGGLRASGSNDPVSESIVRMSDTSGQIQMQFVPPEVAGRHAITARCVAIECFAPDVPLSVEVKVDGLAAISPLPTFYTLTEYLQQPIGQNIGDNTKHDGENHYLTPEATGVLMKVAFYYAAEYAARWGQFPEKLHINDASLPSGGLFDYSGTWVYTKGASHFEHRRGTVVDIRANELLGAVPPSPDADRMFMRAAATAGAQATREYAKRVPRHPNEHYHLRLRGARE